MPDKFTEVTRVGYGSRIGRSLKNVVVGFLLFIASFIVLYVNEGRTDFSKVARKTVPINAETAADANLQGKPVSLSGTLATAETIGDSLFLKPGAYIAVKRTSEMYAWEEEKRTKTKRERGGSETKETTYEYEKEWTERPDDSRRFKYPKDHENPVKAIESAISRVNRARVGLYALEVSSLDLPEFNPLPLSPDLLTLSQNAALASDQYLFVGQGSLAAPQIGDLRIRYGVVPSGITATVFGKLEGSAIIPAFAGDAKLYHLRRGSRDEAIATLRAEYVRSLWIFRAVGFGMMWVGLLFILGPLATILDVLPTLGSISRGIGIFITLPIALVLSLVTIIISRLFHNPIALLITVAVAAGAIVVVLKTLKKKKISPPKT